jgi:hypothetical protein
MAGCWRTMRCAGCCTRVRQDRVKPMKTYPLPHTYSCSNANSPALGLFPPQRPRRRSQWWQLVLHASARLRCVHTRERCSARMVKRRNSPYAPFQRNALRRQPCDFTPKIASPAGRQAAPPRRRPPANEFLEAAFH